MNLSSLNHRCHLHSLQAINCCRNSRLAVDEDYLKQVASEKIKLLLLKQFYKNVGSETPRCGKLGHFLEMQNAALMHRKGFSLKAVN